MRAYAGVLWLVALLGTTLPPRPGACALTADVLGVRTLSMGRAHRALGNSNEALWLNPAGMALTRRYHIDLNYGYGGQSHVNWAQISAVDSKSGPVAGGVAYSRDWGNPSGLRPELNRFDAGAAYAVGQVLAFGASGVNVRGTYHDRDRAHEVDVYNVTSGVSLALGDFVVLGAAYQNMVPTQEPDLLPPTFGAGLGVRTRALSLTGDWSMDLRGPGPRRHRLGGGAEYLLFDLLALRAGVRRGLGEVGGPDAPPATFLSGGLSIVTQSGALGVAMERSLAAVPRWALVSSFQLFL